jgi:crossover junction endodeoxyribonuclease RuvC
MMHYIGIDPGLTGAIALLNETELIDVQDLPTMPVGQGTGRVKNQINAAAFHGILLNLLAKVEPQEDGTPTVFIEKVGAMPDQGIAGAFSLGDTVGCLRGVVVACNLPIQWVTPQSWKKHFRLPREKDVARSVAINLWPRAPLHLKKHHGRAEAGLIALYGRNRERACESIEQT